MFRSTVLALALLTATTLPSRSVAAQGLESDPPGVLSFEVSVGPYLTRGDGNYRGGPDDTLGGDVLLAVRAGRVGDGHLVVGASAASRITPDEYTSDCLVDTVAGGCVPWFPALHMLVAHAGWESASASRRILVGPALVDSDVADASLGGQLRVELATTLHARLGGLLGLRATVVPGHNGDTFWVFAAGAGIRIR